MSSGEWTVKSEAVYEIKLKSFPVVSGNLNLEQEEQNLPITMKTTRPYIERQIQNINTLIRHC